MAGRLTDGQQVVLDIQTDKYHREQTDRLIVHIAMQHGANQGICLSIDRFNKYICNDPLPIYLHGFSIKQPLNQGVSHSNDHGANISLAVLIGGFIIYQV